MINATNEMKPTYVERKLHLTITYNGINRPFAPDPNERVKTLLDRAVRDFGITRNAHLLALYTAEGRELRDAKTLHQEGVGPHGHLLLRPSAVRGG